MSMVQQLISELLQANSGQLINKSTVIDGLLDIRAAAKDDPSLVKEIDGFLKEIPGVTVVAMIWWKSALGDLSKKALVPRALI